MAECGRMPTRGDYQRSCRRPDKGRSTWQLPHLVARAESYRPLFTSNGRGMLISQGDGLMNRNVFALFGAVALLLTATAVLTLSGATNSAGSVGGLKCYNTGGIEKAC